MDITKQNKAIALFMGADYTKQSIPEWAFVKKDFDTVSYGAYEYATSWDWLMPVIEKIETMQAFDDGGDEHAFVRTFSGCMFRFNGCQLFIGNTKIEAAYDAVVDFVKSNTNLLTQSGESL